MTIKPIVFTNDIEKNYLKTPDKKSKAHIDYENGINALKRPYIDDDGKPELIKKTAKSDEEHKFRRPIMLNTNVNRNDNWSALSSNSTNTPQSKIDLNENDENDKGNEMKSSIKQTKSFPQCKPVPPNKNASNRRRPISVKNKNDKNAESESFRPKRPIPKNSVSNNETCSKRRRPIISSSKGQSS